MTDPNLHQLLTTVATNPDDAPHLVVEWLSAALPTAQIAVLRHWHGGCVAVASSHPSALDIHLGAFEATYRGEMLRSGRRLYLPIDDDHALLMVNTALLTGTAQAALDAGMAVLATWAYTRRRLASVRALIADQADAALYDDLTREAATTRLRYIDAASDAYSTDDGPGRALTVNARAYLGRANHDAERLLQADGLALVFTFRAQNNACVTAGPYLAEAYGLMIDTLGRTAPRDDTVYVTVKQEGPSYAPDLCMTLSALGVRLTDDDAEALDDVCAPIIRASGGELRVESDPATLHLTLPTVRG
ncbi:MAG: hypothetical protein AAF125_11320 [Chloroflexota bacterium]